METATQITTEWCPKCNHKIQCEGDKPFCLCPQETPAQKQQVSVAQLATAYLVLSSVVTYGAYWPDEIIEWARDLMRGEKRVGVELVREAMKEASSHA